MSSPCRVSSHPGPRSAFRRGAAASGLRDQPGQHAGALAGRLPLQATGLTVEWANTALPGQKPSRGQCSKRNSPPKSHMQFPQNPQPHWEQNGRISTIRFHNLKYLEGNCMRNLSPGDERRPQGLRAHIHTFTMRAFSDSSAKKFAHCGPSRSSSAKKLSQHTPTNTTPDTKLAQQPLSHRMCGTKLAQQLLSHRMCGTKLAQHETHRATAVQNSPCAPLHTACAVQNSPCSPKMAQYGAF